MKLYQVSFLHSSHIHSSPPSLFFLNSLQLQPLASPLFLFLPFFSVPFSFPKNLVEHFPSMAVVSVCRYGYKGKPRLARRKDCEQWRA